MSGGAGAVYDRIGVGYSAVRRPDPRLAAVIESALGDATVVANIGAGAGSYEPVGRFVIAAEPSTVMLANIRVGIGCRRGPRRCPSQRPASMRRWR